LYKVLITILLLIGGGCTTISLPEQRLGYIVYDDGINAEEAKTIAITYFLEHNKKDMDFNTVRVRESTDYPEAWRVKFVSWIFKKKIILVDKQTGKIIILEENAS